jgi:hypothetical protein
MELHRGTELGPLPRRRQRFFKDNGFWYFFTREGVSVGPFDRINMAVAGSREYIQCVRQTPDLEQVLRHYA